MQQLVSKYFIQVEFTVSLPLNVMKVIYLVIAHDQVFFENLPYAMLAISMLALVVILPPSLLLLYPIQAFRRGFSFPKDMSVFILSVKVPCINIRTGSHHSNSTSVDKFPDRLVNPRRYVYVSTNSMNEATNTKPIITFMYTELDTAHICTLKLACHAISYHT